MNGAELILKERERHITEEGYDAGHDNQYTKGELVQAALCYIQRAGQRCPVPSRWPWDPKFWKPKTKEEDLVRAGALLAAQIDLDKRIEKYLQGVY